ncbi:MAG: hypothetical protein P8X96_07060 [Desulfobacteraceae bacterium]
MGHLQLETAFVLSQRPPVKRVACFTGHMPEKQKHASASIVAVVAGCIAPGLKTTNKGRGTRRGTSS